MLSDLRENELALIHRFSLRMATLQWSHAARGRFKSRPKKNIDYLFRFSILLMKNQSTSGQHCSGAMDKTSILSKTGKGLLHLKYKSHELLAVEFRVLKLIDGKTQVGDLIRKSPMNEVDLLIVLKALLDGSLVREVTSTVAIGWRNATICAARCVGYGSTACFARTERQFPVRLDLCRPVGPAGICASTHTATSHRSSRIRT